MSTPSLIVNSLRVAVLHPRTVKLVALSYGLKTLAFGVAWYFVPDLPQRLVEATQAAWAWVIAL